MGWPRETARNNHNGEQQCAVVSNSSGSKRKGKLRANGARVFEAASIFSFPCWYGLIRRRASHNCLPHDLHPVSSLVVISRPRYRYAMENHNLVFFLPQSMLFLFPMTPCVNYGHNFAEQETAFSILTAHQSTNSK